MHIISTSAIKPVSLALQGAGVYGAFTWGVLDRLLDEQGFVIDSLSGSSSGAVNAVVLADGWSQGGGRRGAQQALRRFWTALGGIAAFSPLQPSPLDRISGRWTMENSLTYLLLEMAGALMGPVAEQPLTVNPLRNIFATLIDFERVRACDDLELFIAATNVRTGAGKLFTRAEMDPQRLLASACLPTVFAGAMVDGEMYWDGSYVANPPLAPLLEQAPRDLIVIQNNPVSRTELPRSMADISNRANEIAFNISFVREISALQHLGGLPDEERGASAHARRMRLHLISGAATLGEFALSSKFNAQPGFLNSLHAMGVKAAEQWLRDHAGDVGVRSTLDPSPVFFSDLARTA